MTPGCGHFLYDVNVYMARFSENFLLSTPVAERLFHTYAQAQPILDFHCHLTAETILRNERFRDLHHIWLEGDHYKWRLMRADGAAERLCTGDAPPWEKFAAWARTAPRTLRNPIAHWNQLELVRYFGIDQPLNEASAPEIWKRANEMLAGDELRPQAILRKFKVRAVCTTDDPADDLAAHRELARHPAPAQVFPTFRPNAIAQLDEPGVFRAWLDRLGPQANIEIARLADLEQALRLRHQAFHELGCRASDHGLLACPREISPRPEAERLFETLRAGRALPPEEAERMCGFLLDLCARLDAEQGWAMQLHLGALRNVNPPMMRRLGRDTGFDTISDRPLAAGLAAFLGRLSEANALPKMVLYNLNPAGNYILATLAGCFQGGSTPGKIQLGSAWWFLDHKPGIEAQLNALSETGLLARFVGMVTDSRSFLSYPRHEYFRRVLCNLIGRELESGELLAEEKAAGEMIADICYANAERYFQFPLANAAAAKNMPATRPA